MGVTTTKINKPLNPRAQDQSPLAYNRAALYSGKALDFDGVNDYVDLDGFTLSGTSATFVFNLKMDDWLALRFIFDADPQRLVIGTGNNGNEIGLYDSNAWKMFGTITDTTSTNHFAIVTEGTTAKCFLNGQSFGTDQTITAINLSSASSVALGSRNDAVTSFLNGQIAGFKIFNTALTAAQIADLYNFPEKIVPIGVDNTALKLWLPMMEGAGTTAFNGAPDALGSEAVTNGDFATDSDWTKVQSTISNGKATITSADGSYAGVYQNFLTIGKTYSYSIDVYSVTNGVSIYSGSSLSRLMTSPGNYKGTFVATNIRLEIKRNAGDIMSAEIDNVSVKEASGFGTISGATWTNGIGAPVAQTAVINWNKVSDGTNSVLIPQGLTTGRDLLGNLFENVRKQGALNLDGQSWAEVHDNESLDFGTGSWTAESWVYWDGISSGDGIISRWYITERAMLFYTQGTFIKLYTGITNGTADNNISSSTISVGWRHIVGTYDSSDTKLRIYIDGALDVTSSAFANAYNSNAQSLEIGRLNNDPNTFYTNDIAQPRIYNRALSAEEIQRNYNAGKNIYS